MTSLRGVTAKQAVLRLHRTKYWAYQLSITKILQLRRNLKSQSENYRIVNNKPYKVLIVNILVKILRGLKIHHS